MLYSLKGIIVYYDAVSVAVECSGVAYHCQTSLSTVTSVGEVGSEATLYTYLHVREGAIDLFGFADKGELACFKMLLGVTGVGPKAALAILSQMSPERFALCVASGDHKLLTVAQGVGPKLAQRIILELRDKVSTADIAQGIGAPVANIAVGSGNMAEAVSALVVLGYSQSEAAASVATLPPDLPVEDMIKTGLKSLAAGYR
ncbi:MAG: Holliday junction branch migration protein RuvA [Oscillospiraceae bacterium]|jgi:Holliday junction DNA helicase RuvA|nr:Holliday junction branch migration protein RuvA [Oscillospiraceae bacterium]